MNNEMNDINVLNRTKISDFYSLTKVYTSAPFSEPVIAYLDELSKVLFKDLLTRKYPDVSTFAFYCRKGNLLDLKKKFGQKDEVRLGRGVIFHVAPSNVPVNFAYSLIAGLLSGNSNVIRLPSRNFEQIEIIIKAINCLAEKECHKDVSSRIVLIKYDSHDGSITRQLSSLCAVRVIWGGDETIRNIRKYDLAPRSFDLTFADRYSMCVIHAESFVNEVNIDAIISGFYNDTYLFDQNACTSPHLVLWLGSKEKVEKAQFLFWSELLKLVKTKYKLQTIQSVDKITNFYSQAIGMIDVNLTKTENNLLWRVKLNSLEENIENFRCSGGYFSEYHAASLSELVSVINPKYQSLSYYGVPKNELVDFISNERPNGIDRIVPIGKTTDFSLIWDGYNLINTLSRAVQLI